MIRQTYPYSAYKPSGVPWLGDVPEHWDVRRFKVFYREVDERSTTGSEELMSVSHKTGVTPRKRNVTMFLAESNVGYKVCQPGDIVINTMWAYMAALGVAWQKGLVSPSYGVYRPLPRSILNPDYIDRLLRTEEYRTAYLARSTGITDSRLRLYPEQFLGIPLLCPPLVEQDAIVRYLDYADRRIRRYVSAKRKLIALLEEEKQAAINQAVTRGLDPNVRLKPSGVEWLGHVPAHWKVVQLGRIGVFSKGSGGTKDDEVPEGTPCVRYGDLYTTHKFFINQTRSYISPAKASTYTPINRGEVLFPTSGETIEEIGKSAVNLMKTQVLCGGDLIIFSPTIPMEPKFLGYALDCPDAQTQKSLMGRGITIMHIYSSQLKYLWLPLPPLDEQAFIVESLDKTTARIDTAIACAHRQIELLEEYHTRLVADVVTGKLDVREAVAQLPEEAGEDGPIDDDSLIVDNLDDDLDTSQPPEAEEEAIA